MQDLSQDPQLHPQTKRRTATELKPVTTKIEADGATLSGIWCEPPGATDAVAVLHGATGAPQRYYRHFARWLAEERGVACLTYDYRDFGASATGPVRASRATMADWGIKDQAAALSAATDRAAMTDAPVWVIGHSLGGFMTSFHANAGAIDRLIAVASGPVHVSDHPLRYLPLALAFWYGFGPAVAALTGIMPGRLFGAGPGANLPAPVYWQWRRWCTSRDFFACDIARGLMPPPDPERFQGRLKMIAVADDDTIPPHTVWRLARHYPEAWRSQLTLKPEAYGLGDVGHLGAFARRNAALWPDIIA
ncbi:MAG: alpha/beta fold hydrolase [Pseudomonadota bacterium]